MAIVASHNRSVGATSAIELPQMSAENGWRQALKEAIRDPAELCRVLDLDPCWIEPARQAAETFPLFVPRSFVSRMRPGDPLDPLLRQVLPLGEERLSPAPFRVDPVGDGEAQIYPGLLQKYASRVLLVTTGACAIHCRYCFRRHFPYEESPKSLDRWETGLQGIAQDASIHEVILSGGDPLTLTDPFLAALAEKIAEIPHVRRLRIHTRLPIVIPERVTQDLVTWLTAGRLAPIVVVHVNHPAELDRHVAEALGRLSRAGVPLLNQAVLLKGINDRLETLLELCERLVDLRVIPYYLHQLDRVAGAAHFEVEVEQGKSLVRQLRTRLSGYAVPKYVVEIAGDPSKRPLEVVSD